MSYYILCFNIYCFFYISSGKEYCNIYCVHMYRYILFYKPCTIYTPPPLTDARTFGGAAAYKSQRS